MKTKVRKIIHIIQYIIIFILVILIAYIAYQKFILKKQNVTFFNHNFFIIMSGSMEPTIKTKDLISTYPKDVYEQGDIIAFYNDSIVTVHRIESIKVENETTYYVTKGDNNNAPDIESISKEDIIGVYKFTVPLLGSIILFFYTYPILFVTLIIALILIYAIIKLIRNRN